MLEQTAFALGSDVMPLVVVLSPAPLCAPHAAIVASPATASARRIVMSGRYPA
jgi:hypothetical protein